MQKLFESWRRYITEQEETDVVTQQGHDAANKARQRIIKDIEAGGAKKRYTDLGYSDEDWASEIQPKLMGAAQNMNINISAEEPEVEGRRPHGMYDADNDLVNLYPKNIQKSYGEDYRYGPEMAKRSLKSNLENTATEEMYHFLDRSVKLRSLEGEGETTASEMQGKTLKSLIMPWDSFTKTLSREELGDPKRMAAWKQQHDYIANNETEVYAKSKALQKALGGRITPNHVAAICRGQQTGHFGPKFAGMKDLIRFINCDDPVGAATKLDGVASAAPTTTQTRMAENKTKESS
mgnify:CR=1 FL=1